MDRLTKKEFNRMEDFCFKKDCDLYESKGCCSYKRYKRLAAYEDTGLSPEEIHGLCEMDKRSRMARMLRWEQAEAEGRLIVLPCKVGDTVCVIRNYRGKKHPQQGIVSEMYFLKDMTLQICVKHVARGKFGKTVFLTREEAEAALKGESNGGRS